MSTEIKVGQKFGRWEVIAPEVIINGRHKCLCRCSCDSHTQRYVEKFNLLSSKSLSCGCLTKESSAKRMTKHGKNKTRLYNVWASMRERCYCKTSEAYPNYGGRGIKLCDEWFYDYSSFEKWAYENGYNEIAKKRECTIDRIDVNGDYCPANCRWVSQKEQNNNTRLTIHLTYNGKTQTLLEWASELSINPKTLRNRYDKGLAVEDILFPNLRRKPIIVSYKGETHNLYTWSKITGIAMNTLRNRYLKGYPLDQVFSKEKMRK